MNEQLAVWLGVAVTVIGLVASALRWVTGQLREVARESSERISDVKEELSLADSRINDSINRLREALSEADDKRERGLRGEMTALDIRWAAQQNRLEDSLRAEIRAAVTHQEFRAPRGRNPGT